MEARKKARKRSLFSFSLGMNDQTPEQLGQIPRVIVFAGNTVRRIHALAAAAYLLKQNNAPFRAFSFSLTGEESEFIQKKSSIGFESFQQKKFEEAFATLSQQSGGVIFLEAPINSIDKISFANYHVDTLVLVDLMCETAEMAFALEAYFADQTRKAPHFDTIIYNNDIPEVAPHEQAMRVLHADDIPVKNHFSFGQREQNFLRYRVTEKDLVISLPNMELQRSLDYTYSTLRWEGTIAGFSALLIVGVLTNAEQIILPPSFPYIEEYENNGTRFVWTKHMTTLAEITPILASTRFLCLGVSTYMKYEQAIENTIISLDRVVVVTEFPEQESLVAEEFMKKERDSSYTISFVPSLEAMKELAYPLFAGSPAVYMSDDLALLISMEKLVRSVV